MTNNTSNHDNSKTYTFPKGTTLQKSSIISVLCRICYDGDKDEELIQPCSCKGTVAFVHKSCLETWLGESNTTACELCHTTFKTERTPRYNTQQSVWQWIRTNPSGLATAVRSDIVACAVITPLAIVITYICLFSSEYYNQKKFSNVPAARWTSVSLLIMIGIMLIGYYLWVYSVIRMHARMWYNWWQRTCDVRYIAPIGVEADAAVTNDDTTSVSRDISVPSEISNFSSDTNQATVIEMKELLKHMPPKHVQSKSHEMTVIEIENTQNGGHTFSACTENMEHSMSSDICNIQKTQPLILKDDQQPTCSTAPIIQKANQPTPDDAYKTQDIDTQTKGQFSSTRSPYIAACVSAGISANQQFSKKDQHNIADEFGSIGISEKLFSKELLSSVSEYDTKECKGNKQPFSSTASQSEELEPCESQVSVDSQYQGRSQHVMGDVSSQVNSSDRDNKKC
nr:unnamed protein product [Callosobruchus chinensis]